MAREALLSQHIMDQRKAQGENITISEDILRSIQPTLRRLNGTDVDNSESSTTQAPEPPTPEKKNKKKRKDKAKKSESDAAAPVPAKKEDVVFEVTAANFQQIVLESPVPVLLDVYADWCGPCKQLGPVLEQAAIKAGGMFRVAKVNADNEKAVSEALGVTGLPTVFTVSKGKINDR